jgi:hypothetical protein
MNLLKLLQVTVLMYVIALIAQKIKDRLDEGQP